MSIHNQGFSPWGAQCCRKAVICRSHGFDATVYLVYRRSLESQTKMVPKLRATNTAALISRHSVGAQLALLSGNAEGGIGRSVTGVAAASFDNFEEKPLAVITTV